MTGLYGAILLSSDGDSATPQQSCKIIEEQHSQLPGEPQFHRLINQKESCIGSVKPDGSQWVTRIAENPDTNQKIIYFGDGRIQKNELLQILCDGTYESLAGFYLVVVIDYSIKNEGVVDDHSRVKRCTLIRDRCGNLPLVYRIANNVLTFSPRIYTLHSAQPEISDLNPTGLGFLFSAGYIPGSETQFRSISQVEPGTSMTFLANQQAEKKRYWQVPRSKKSKPTESELLSKATGCMRSAIQNSYSEPKKTIVFLSGGADSRLIAQVCVDSVSNPADVSTVSWGETGSDQAVGTDTYVASALARKWGTTHSFYEKRLNDYGSDFSVACQLTDWLGESSWANPQQWRILQQLQQSGFRRCLRGDQPFASDGPAMSKEYAHAQMGLTSLALQPLASKLLISSVYQEWVESIDSFLKALPQPEDYTTSDLRDVYKIQYKIGSSHQYEALSKMPFLDHISPLLDESFLELFNETHTSNRSYKNVYWKLLRKLSTDTADISFASANSDPDVNLYFRKGGMAYDFFQEALDDQDSLIYQFFDKDAIRELFVSLSSESQPSTPKNPMLKRAKNIVKLIGNRVAPKRFSRIAYRKRSAGSLNAAKALGRFLVIKNFLDSHFKPENLTHFRSAVTE